MTKIGGPRSLSWPHITQNRPAAPPRHQFCSKDPESPKITHFDAVVVWNGDLVDRKPSLKVARYGEPMQGRAKNRQYQAFFRPS
eukprot:1157908-Pelagomonas_calceolata.AAC.4